MRRLLPFLLVVGLLLVGPAAMAGESRSYHGTTDQGKAISFRVERASGGWVLTKLAFHYRCEWSTSGHEHLAYHQGGGPFDTPPSVPHGFYAELGLTPSFSGFIRGHVRQSHSTGNLAMTMTQAPSTATCDTGRVSWRANAR